MSVTGKKNILVFFTQAQKQIEQRPGLLCQFSDFIADVQLDINKNLIIP